MNIVVDKEVCSATYFWTKAPDRPTGPTEWARDPIASRLKNRTSPELRQNIVRSAAEAQSKRERR